MAKEKDLNLVLCEILNQLDDYPAELEDFLSTQQVALIVLTIYVNYDSERAIGMDFEHILSVIATKRRITIIGSVHASFYKTETDYVRYENLTDDIKDILIVLDSAVGRWRSF